MNSQQIKEANGACPALKDVGLGNVLAGILSSLVLFGRKFYLDPVNGNDGNDGTSRESAKRTLPEAYKLLIANQNDALCIVGGASSIVLTTPFTWDKDYTHLLGIAGNLKFGGRARIGHAGTAMSPMFTISASGCIFDAIHFQHGQASATNLIDVDISGLRNLFSNCHFEASLDSVASGASYAWRNVQIEAGAQANNFVRCTFGSWTTVWASANGKLVYFMGDNADTYFEDCEFITNTSSTSMKVIDFAGAISGGQSGIKFKKCHFSNRNAAPAVIFGNPTNGWIERIECTATNFTAWALTYASHVSVDGPQSILLGGKAIPQT